LLLIDSKERELFQNNNSIMAEISKQLHNQLKREYELIKQCKPKLITRNKEYFDLKYSSMKVKQVELDQGLEKAKEEHIPTKSMIFWQIIL